jgi:hypothetical protein
VVENSFGIWKKKIRGLLLKLNLHNLFLLDMMVCCYIVHNMVFAQWEKKKVLQLALQFNFWVEMMICNSQYLYDVSVIGQVAWSARVAIHHIYDAIHCNSIATLFKQLIFSYYAINSITITTITSCWITNLHSFIKFWHMALWRFLDLKIISFWNYRLLLLLMMARDYDMLHQMFLPHGILIEFWTININIYI